MMKLNRTVSNLQEGETQYADSIDRDVYEANCSMELRIGRREQKLIYNIDRVLQKLHSENFGYCEECGDEIGIKRLEATPIATLCISCKTYNEQFEK